MTLMNSYRFSMRLFVLKSAMGKKVPRRVCRELSTFFVEMCDSHDLWHDRWQTVDRCSSSFLFLHDFRSYFASFHGFQTIRIISLNYHCTLPSIFRLSGWNGNRMKITSICTTVSYVYHWLAWSCLSQAFWFEWELTVLEATEKVVNSFAVLVYIHFCLASRVK